jgi:hypothetical protein
MGERVHDELPLEDWEDTADAWMTQVLLETDGEARVERVNAREEHRCTL